MEVPSGPGGIGNDIHPFIYSISRLLLSTYYVPDTVLGTESKAVNLSDKFLPSGASSLCGEINKRQMNQ